MDYSPNVRPERKNITFFSTKESSLTGRFIINRKLSAVPIAKSSRSFLTTDKHRFLYLYASFLSPERSGQVVIKLPP
jgi:hypothetical protein